MNISSKLMVILPDFFRRPIPRLPSRGEVTVPPAGTDAGMSLKVTDASPIVRIHSGTFTISCFSVPPCPHVFWVSIGRAPAVSAFFANQRSVRSAPLLPVSRVNASLLPLLSVTSMIGIF